jgi:hypothetical protein
VQGAIYILDHITVTRRPCDRLTILCTIDRTDTSPRLAIAG